MSRFVFATLLFALVSLIASAEEGISKDFNRCYFSWQCTYVFNSQSCEAVAINKKFKDQINKKFNSRGPLEEMTVFDAACSNHGYDLEKMSSRCEKRSCEVSMDGQTYTATFKLLGDNWWEEYRQKMDMK